MEALTCRQLEILRFIAKTSEERGFPPTIREIGSEFSIRSTNGVNDHLKAIERKGFLSRGEQQSRALVPTRQGRLALGLGTERRFERSVEVPLVGRVAAGAPLLAEQNLSDSLQVDSSLLPGAGRDVFALRVKGDSMVGDGIHDGDLVFVRQQPTCANGEIAVALVEGEATVKRFFPEGARIRLQPSNPAMAPLYLDASAARDVSVLGVVVGVFRRVQVRG